MSGGAHRGGLQRHDEDEAAVGRVAPRAPGGELLSVGRAEERVEPAARRAGPDAEKRGQEGRPEGAAEEGGAAARNVRLFPRRRSCFY